MCSSIGPFQTKTGPSCVRGAATSLMIIIIFWVQHRSGARDTSNKLWRKGVWKQRFALTDPEVIEPLAHGATLVWDLVEVLVETWLERDEPRQGREVVFWEARARSVQAHANTQNTFQKEIKSRLCYEHEYKVLQPGFALALHPGCGGRAHLPWWPRALCFHLQTVTQTSQSDASNPTACRERTEVTLPLSAHSTGHNPPQAPPGWHQHQRRC